MDRKQSYESLGASIQVAGQCVVDYTFGHQYNPDDLLNTIRSHTANIPSEADRNWAIGRMAFQVSLGGLDHLVTAAAIVNEEAALPNPDPEICGLDSLQRFDSLTTGLYIKPGRDIVHNANDPEHPLHEAGKFCKESWQLLLEAEMTEGFDPFRAGGKLWIARVQPDWTMDGKLYEDAVVQTLSGNTRTVKQLIVVRAIAHTIQHEGLPPDDITQRLGAEFYGLAMISTAVLQQQFEWLYGRSIAVKIRDRMKKLTSDPFDESLTAWKDFLSFLNSMTWSNALKRFLETETGNDAAFEPCSVAGALLESEIPDFRIIKSGRCHGGSVWTPNAKYAESVQKKFNEHGYPMAGAGAFSVAQYQLARGIEAADRTILANREFLDAIAAAANFVMQKRKI